MQPEYYQLWDRMNRYSLDNKESQMTISDRLAAENMWTKEYARRAIEEYKRFVFLGLVSGHKVTPSDQVDQVWHLHMIYTEEYWDNFCKNVLKVPFHHGPTKGGKAEDTKFEDWYKRTKLSYYKIFEEVPPIDIWPPSSVRFSESYMRVCKNNHLIINTLSYPKLSKLIVKLLKIIKLCGF